MLTKGLPGKTPFHGCFSQRALTDISWSLNIINHTWEYYLRHCLTRHKKDTEHCLLSRTHTIYYHVDELIFRFPTKIVGIY